MEVKALGFLKPLCLFLLKIYLSFFDDRLGKECVPFRLSEKKLSCFTFLHWFIGNFKITKFPIFLTYFFMKNIYFFTFLLLGLFSCTNNEISSNNKETSIDSLSTVVDTTNIDTVKLDTVGNLDTTFIVKDTL